MSDTLMWLVIAVWTIIMVMAVERRPQSRAIFRWIALCISAVMVAFGLLLIVPAIAIWWFGASSDPAGYSLLSFCIGGIVATLGAMGLSASIHSLKGQTRH